MITFLQIEEITKGRILDSFQDKVITELTIDSRKASISEGSLFFAIKGARNDGHDHIQELYNRGVRQFVVERNITFIHHNDVNVLKVKSSIEALQLIAASHRKQFSIPVIGVTGSNGKTIIKEWVYQLLSKDYNCIKNPGSYNSQVGVPLSVWQMQSYHQLGIFEAGISKEGEMENLQRIINPTLGIFTNIGSAHDEGFQNEKSKIREKLTLFKNVTKLIYCIDHVAIHNQIAQTNISTLSWGFTGEPSIKVKLQYDSVYSLKYKEQQFELTLTIRDSASIENTFHCVALLIHLNFNQQQIQERINLLQAIPMRLELKEGINQCYLIDDTYNNDLGGLQISLDFLTNQKHKKNKRLILSDIQQSGLAEEELVKKIALLVNGSNLQHFIGIGASLTKFKHFIEVSGEYFNSTDEFLQNFDFEKLQEEIILIKGARAFQFEKIVAQLQRKVHGTVVEIDLDAMVHNLNYFKSRLAHKTKVMAMVKAFAYGSGSSEVASLLQYHNIDYLGVAYADEGIELRKNNIALPIMVMNPSEESFASIQLYNLEPEIYSFKILDSLLKSLNGKSCKIHIKVDTGMHRLGFEENDADKLLSGLLTNPQIHVASIFSHLAGADEAMHDNFSKQQAEHFKSFADKLSTGLGYKPLYHVLNSPGILRLSQYQFDMVRLGIGLYGVDPTANGFNELKPVATLKSIISQIKTIAPGETVGYGRRGKADKATTIATIAIGYADGYNRAFSRGVGEVLINGQRAKVIGNVCMDMTMIDITDIDAKEGDEVIIFGKGLPIQEVAAKVNTIAYEILTNTSDRVKRVFVAESI
ncbi:MAG TPA: bifunctional UDP-N-acetylmuramoyl-tripeptide:D-alanyl-D-alanine ligase/alanine racemase [Cyclobacteriaceae bacterium]